MTVKITDKGSSFEIRFAPWDGYSKRDVGVIKQVPGARYNPLHQIWTAPGASRTEIEALKISIKAQIFLEKKMAPEVYGEVPALPEPTLEPSLHNITMRHYQLQGTERMIDLESCINGDDPGLGKTIQAICTAVELKKFPVVVICPATLKLNWHNEITKHSNLRCMILADSNKQSWMRYYEVGRIDVFIVNYESLKKYFVISMPEKKAGSKFLSKNIVLRPEWEKVQCVIIDESHRLKDPTTIQTKLCLRLCHTKKHVYLLTGTPVVNKPVDLFPQLAIMGHLDKFGGKAGFIERYCDGGSGANNLKELNFLLNKYCYFKRNKRDVLTEIPPKQRQTMVCEISTRKEYDFAENEFKRWLQTEGCTDREIAKKMRAEILVKMNALRNISARGKIPAVREYTNDLIASGEKVVLFANLKVIFSMLGEHYKDALYIYGDIPFDQRQRNIELFQNDPKRNLIICGIKPAGVGVTLTASSNIGIIEYPWHWADCLQIEDRLDRIGQRSSVTATYFFGEGTIDQRLFDIIQNKKEVSNTISGSVDNIQMETIDKILNLFS